VLTKGKDTYEHTIELNYDDTALTTMAERKEQEQLTRTLFDMVEELAYMVYTIGETQEKAKEVMENHPKGQKTAEKLYNALEALRADLVVTTGDNYVASAEPELRERMGELYSNVAGSYDQVSGSQKQNFELISEEFKEAKARYAKIMDKEGKKFMEFLEKNSIEKPSIDSKDVFLSDD
jgi:hypothetical protein